jgi:hypothetical protein
MEQASQEAKRKVLQDIEHNMEMEVYYGSKVLRTPIEDSAEDRRLETMYTERRLNSVALAKKMGISKEEINDAKDRGFDKAYDAIEEADNQGWQ